MPSLESARATETAFLEDVCRHPDDDTARLILADWLDEHGQPERAELIRVQCELARLGPVGRSAADMRINGPVQTLRRREWALLDAHRREWLTEAAPPGARYWQSATEHGWALPGPAGDGGEGLDGVSVVFRRGFAEEVTLTAGAFVEHAAALFRAAPITRATLSVGEPSQYPGSLGRERWYWYGAPGPPVSINPHRVPLAIWDLLEPHELDQGNVPLWCSRQAALDALSAACLLHGRRAAWPCRSCGGTGRFFAGADMPADRCPACAGRGHTVEEG